MAQQTVGSLRVHAFFMVLALVGCGGGATGAGDGRTTEPVEEPSDAGLAGVGRDASDALDADLPDDGAVSPDASSSPPLVPGCDKPHASGRRQLAFDIAGVMREVTLYVPAGYTGDAPLPFTFNLHGSGGNPAGQLDYSAIQPLADGRGFIVAALAGYQGRWNVARKPELPDDVAFAEAVLDWSTENLCIDRARVFSTGFSGGARTSSRLACALPHRIRAIAPIAGVRHDPPCEVSGIPVLTMHGTADGTNLYAGCSPSDTGCSRNGEWVEGVEPAVSDWRASNGCAEAPQVEQLSDKVERRSFTGCASGADVVFYRVADGAHVWDLLPNTTEVVLDFFLAQPRR
jgi:polyhydroxybutyrate depolymerase